MVIDTQKVELLIAEKGITKAQLAQKTGFVRQNISTILKRGTCEPRTAGKLAAGLGVPVADILPEVKPNA